MSLAYLTILSAGTGAAIVFYLLLREILRLTPLYRRQFADGVSRQLASAFIYVHPARLLALNTGLALLAAGLGLLLGGSLVLSGFAAACSGLMPRLVLGLIRRRRGLAFREQLSDLMLLTAGGLRAGVGLVQALGQTATEMQAPARQEIELMLREQRLGATLDQALAGLERRMPFEETALLCAALRISRETGGNLAETLESLGDTIRRKIAIEGKIRALTAQGRLQGWAMGLLPALCCAALWLIEPLAMRALFTSTHGLLVCAVICVMQALGAYFLNRVMRIDV